MIALESRFSLRQEHEHGDVVYCRTREEILAATRVELAELLEQRRLLVERLAPESDAMLRPKSSSRASSRRNRAPLRPVSSWAGVARRMPRELSGTYIGLVPHVLGSWAGRVVSRGAVSVYRW